MLVRELTRGIQDNNLPDTSWHDVTEPRNKALRNFYHQHKLTFWLPVGCVSAITQCSVEEFAMHNNRSEYWMNTETLDTMALATHVLPLRFFQLLLLCKPRSVVQILSAAWAAFFGLVRFITMTNQRCCFFGNNGSYRGSEKCCNYFCYTLRFCLLAATVVVGLIVVFDNGVGLPDIFVYIQPTAGPLVSGNAAAPLAYLCYAMNRSNATRNPFLLPDVARDGGRATCVVPGLSEEICTQTAQNNCTDKPSSPVFVTFQIDEDNHQLYHTDAVAINQPQTWTNHCIAAKETYRVILVEQRRDKSHDTPQSVRPVEELEKLSPSGSAVQQGRCIIKEPRRNARKVMRSCVEEKHRVCLEERLLAIARDIDNGVFESADEVVC